MRMSNSLDLDQDQHSVRPDLGPKFLERLSADNKKTLLVRKALTALQVIVNRSSIYNILYFHVGIHDNYSSLVELMETIGGPVTKLEPEQIVMITQAGSFMYGLSTPTSDVDYIVIYADKTEVRENSRISEIYV